MNRRRTMTAAFVLVMATAMSAGLQVAPSQKAEPFRGPGESGASGESGGAAGIERERTAVEPDRPAVRFAAVDVYLDSGDAPLAAYQLHFTDATGRSRIVGIEGGAHAAFNAPPYYDPKAMMRDQVILAAFSMSEADRLPHGRTRIATIHVQVQGEGEPDYAAQLVTAASDSGKVIPVTVTLQTQTPAPGPTPGPGVQR